MPASLSLGTMNFGGRTPAPEAARVLAAALHAGVTHFDTANVYTDGASERIVGAALRGTAAEVATKVGLARIAGRPEGLSPARVLAACDESLARLGRDCIDLYYLHSPDPETPPEATLEAIAKLLANGKIRAWGVSNFASWQILELVHLADAAGMPRPARAQQLYNVLVRQLDIEYFAYARRHPIHTTVYNPLAGGLLAAAPATDGSPPAGGRFHKNPLYQRRYWQPPLFAAARTLTTLAAESGHTLLELAYGFAFSHPGVDSVLVGPATEAHLHAALAARSVELTPAELKGIAQVALSLTGTDARYAR